MTTEDLHIAVLLLIGAGIWVLLMRAVTRRKGVR